MKSFKKIISIFLAVLMLCSVITAAGVSATAVTTQANTTGTDAVNVTVKSYQGLFADVTREYNVGDKFTIAVNLDMKGKDPIDTMFNVKFDSNALKVTADEVNPIIKPVTSSNISEALQKEKNKVDFNFSTPNGSGLTTNTKLVTYTVEVLNVPGTNQTMTLDYQLLNELNADTTQAPIKYIDQKAENGNEGPGFVQAGKENLFNVSVDVSASTFMPTEPKTTVGVTVKSYQGLFADVTREYNVGDKFTVAVNLDMKGKDPVNSMFNVKFNSNALKVTAATINPAIRIATLSNISEAVQKEKNKVDFNFSAQGGCGLTTKTTLVTYTVEVLNVPGTNQTMTLDYQLLNALNSDTTKDPIVYINQKNENGNEGPGFVEPGAENLFEVSVDVSASTVKPTEATTASTTEATEATTASTTEATEATTASTTEATTASTTEVTEATTVAPTTTAPTTGATEATTVAPTTTAPATEATETTAPATQKPTEKPTTAPAKPANNSQSVSNVSNKIAKTNTDKGDVKGSKFAPLKFNAKSTKNKTVKLSWSKVSGAKGYIIYGAKCGKTMKKMKTLSSSKKSYTVKKLKKGKYYKYMVVAYKNVKGTQTAVSTSKIAHVAVKGGKYGNPTKVTVKKIKPIKKGKKYTIKYSVKKSKKVKNHVKVRFESTNTKIATVSSKGKITAKKKGKCSIYVYAQNGIYKKVKITVK